MYLIHNTAIFLSHKEPAGYAASFSSAARLVILVSAHIVSLGLNFIAAQSHVM